MACLKDSEKYVYETSVKNPDKEKKEAENRKKLYQAFMQQRINEEEEAKQKKSFWQKIK